MKKNLLVMMAVLAMGMVGCSQAPAMEAPAEDTAVSEEVKSTENKEVATTLIIEHDLGKTEVEINPENVVVFDYGILDSLDYMGVEITGVPQSSSMPEHL